MRTIFIYLIYPIWTILFASQASILEEKATSLMTKNPRTVTKDMISAEALKIMHDKKITNMFVLEGTKPIGVIHIHDLLNNGVA